VSFDVAKADLDHTSQALEEILAELTQLFKYESVGGLELDPFFRSSP
jgi:hypothetical protein